VKIKKRRWWNIFIYMAAVVLIMGAATEGAYGVNYSVYAGCAPEQPPYSATVGLTTFGTVKDAGGLSLASGNPVQYINASGGYIVGPNSDGTPGAGETLIQSLSVGDDTDTYKIFSSTAGKFYHTISGQTTVNNFYVRVWDGDPTNQDSNFGESQIFSANTNPDFMPLPNDVGLSDFKVMFPKSAPDTPSELEVTRHSTSATAKFKASVGARFYTISWGTDTNASNGLTSTSYNTQHYPSPNSTDGESIGMSGLSDDTDYYVKVRAGNSFGDPSSWSSVVAFHTTTLPDPTPPQTVTDLRVSGTGGSAGAYTVTLKWTAPYDTDRLNNHVNVSGYDIRYSASPILSSTLEGFTDWNSATLFDPTYATPAPLTPGTEQEITITGLSSGTKFFAIKSKDPYNWSAMSNVTGAQLGTGGGGGYTGTTTIEPGWNLIASGQGASMLLDNSNLRESGGYAGGLIDGDLIYQHIPLTSDFNEAYLTMGGWIDVNTTSAPTWEIDPDRGYFYMNRGSQFIWTRP